MNLKSVFLLGAAALGLVQGRSCGNPNRNGNHREINSKLAARETRAYSAKYGSRDTDTSSIHVNVYMHSVSATKGGLLSDKDFQNQFEVIADRYGPHEITFELKNTSRTVSYKWSNGTDEYAMKKALRQGDYKSLNLYFTDAVMDDTGSDETLGICYYPTKAPKGSEDYILDGCMVMATTIPGGSSEYNEGITAVHEIGHWFGLAHTFDFDADKYPDGCSGPGDGVYDTPASASESEGCPVGRNSCKKKPGVDPIHNYMDYSDDSCMTEFSTGQIKRINSFWNVYRESWPDVLELEY